MGRLKANGRRRGLGPARSAVPVVLALASMSCVPASASHAPVDGGPAAPAPKAAAPAPPVSAEPVVAKPAFLARTPIDRRRSHDCLAQAIYYEAASESDDGRRAVAQVVLNRVRHPAWPDSVCGVVYQGPMRAGGGCQFTFTCDGSLARRPSGRAWSRARAIAAEALAGRVFEPVGLSTHYHTHAVSPAWAPALRPTRTIGAHRFYSLRGRRGEASAFAEAYSGTEPAPRPVTLFPRRTAPAADVPEAEAEPASETQPSGILIALPPDLERAAAPPPGLSTAAARQH